MKKYLLITLTTVSMHAFAVDCSKVPHSPVPKIKGIDTFAFDEARAKIIKSGWKPVLTTDKYPDYKSDTFYDAEKPEQYCSATLCVLQYQDKHKNTLLISLADFVQSVEIECTKK